MRGGQEFPGECVTVPRTEVSSFVDSISFPWHQWTKAADYQMSDLTTVPILRDIALPAGGHDLKYATLSQLWKTD